MYAETQFLCWTRLDVCPMYVYLLAAGVEYTWYCVLTNLGILYFLSQGHWPLGSGL